MSPKILATPTAFLLIQLTSGLLSSPATAAPHTTQQCTDGWPAFQQKMKDPNIYKKHRPNVTRSFYQDLCQRGIINP
jgi:hypothetical protein